MSLVISFLFYLELFFFHLVNQLFYVFLIFN